MISKKYTQENQVVDTMRLHGGYATLGQLYHLVDTSGWATKTPNESIRRIVQQSKEIFKIQPGLWALEEYRDAVLTKFQLKDKGSVQEEMFTHSYYQGLIAEIGNMKNFTTFVPAQDQNRMFLDLPLKDVCSTTVIPDFGRESFTDRARTIDVIWFNERVMPDSFFEVEHSTDIQNSVAKFCDLRDYYSRFFIVASENRLAQFQKVMERSAFSDIRDRVQFRSYDLISKQYTSMCELRALNERI